MLLIPKMVNCAKRENSGARALDIPRYFNFARWTRQYSRTYCMAFRILRINEVYLQDVGVSDVDSGQELKS